MDVLRATRVSMFALNIPACLKPVTKNCLPKIARTGSESAIRIRFTGSTPP